MIRSRIKTISKQVSHPLNRLWKKFICGTAAIMVFTLVLSLVVNSNIVERYYLRRQTNYVRRIGNQLLTYAGSGAAPEEIIKTLEEKENVLIVYSANISDSEALNMDLREQFRQKGLGFKRFWLWEGDYELAVEHGVKLRLYQQDKLKYGILAEYISTKSGMYAIAAVVPSTAETVGIINRFLIILLTISSVIAASLMYILVRHITNPLKKMEEFSRRISEQNYDSRLEIKTNDELETVADSMNQMSHSIQQYQKMLIEKNRQMEALLDNVAHDLKTPISLVGTYASGIRDGLDDGTFLDTIIRQNARMAQMTEKLLGLSRIGQREYPAETVALDRLLEQQIEEQRILAGHRNLEICTSIEPYQFIEGNAELITAIFSNLLSNSMKYASEGKVEISLLRSAGTGGQRAEDMSLQNTKRTSRFTIANQVQAKALDLEKIWEPFYVGEVSRSQSLSGTGLGLPVVKKITEQCGYKISCEMKDGKIWFTVFF